MKRDIGGNRLGSGGKMEVHMHGYNRSNHDIGNTWRSTMAAGTLVPFLNRVALPGDDFDNYFGVMGKYRLTEPYGDKVQLEKELKKITWDRPLVVIGIMIQKSITHSMAVHCHLPKYPAKNIE